MRLATHTVRRASPLFPQPRRASPQFPQTTFTIPPDCPKNAKEYVYHTPSYPQSTPWGTRLHHG